jgi:hypothetical protein
MVPGLTQRVSEFVPGIFLRSKDRQCTADNYTTSMCRLSRNLGASTYWNAQAKSTTLQGLLYFLVKSKYTISYTAIKKKERCISSAYIVKNKIFNCSDISDASKNSKTKR